MTALLKGCLWILACIGAITVVWFVAFTTWIILDIIITTRRINRYLDRGGPY